MRFRQVFLPSLFSLFGGILLLGGCSSEPSDAATLSSADISDVDSITHRPDGTFDVTCHDGRVLHGLSASDVVSAGLCAPPKSNDPFDPGSCTGAAITSAQVLAMLDPPRGVLEKKVGRFQLVRRDRSCYAGFPCSDWRPGTSEVTAPFTTLSETFTTAASETRFHLNTTGDVVASFKANAVELTLTGDLFSASWGAEFTPDYVSQAVSTSFDPTAASIAASANVVYTWSPSLGCPNGHCEGNENIPGSAGASWAGAPLALTGNATATCVRLAAGASSKAKDAQGNDYTLESQLVFLGDFSAAACKAKTCADQAATCGSVPDGCGGTLTCGTCTFNQTCDANGGNHCRPMTAAEECAASGRVLCPGSSDCWDACF
jgi:hypothetical protein